MGKWSPGNWPMQTETLERRKSRTLVTGQALSQRGKCVGHPECWVLPLLAGAKGSLWGNSSKRPEDSGHKAPALASDSSGGSGLGRRFFAPGVLFSGGTHRPGTGDKVGSQGSTQPNTASPPPEVGGSQGQQEAQGNSPFFPGARMARAHQWGLGIPGVEKEQLAICRVCRMEIC